MVIKGEGVFFSILLMENSGDCVSFAEKHPN